MTSTFYVAQTSFKVTAILLPLSRESGVIGVYYRAWLMPSPFLLHICCTYVFMLVHMHVGSHGCICLRGQTSKSDIFNYSPLYLPRQGLPHELRGLYFG